jgi:hypothetical protein
VTLDLSSITDALLAVVSGDWDSAPIWSELGGGGFSPPSSASPTPKPAPNFTGLAPDQAMHQSGPQLGLYLYHIETNHAAEALFWQPQMMDPSLTGEPVRFLPMAIDAYYLLYAYSENSWIEEQQLMSVALRAFHIQPIIRSGSGVSPSWELTLTPEHRSYDELSQLWQATTAPLRMSLVYRAAIVFLDPEPLTESTIPVQQVTTSVSPVQLNSPVQPELATTLRQLSYTAPGGTKVDQTLSPASAAESQTLVFLGRNLQSAGFSNVYLTDMEGNETQVTSWLVASEETPTSLTMELPSLSSTTSPAVPPPGTYQMAMGSGIQGTFGSLRSQSLRFAIAPWVDSSTGPTLSPSQQHTVSAAGLSAGQTTVSVGTTELEVIATTSPEPGQVYINPSGTSLTFNPPQLAPGSLQPLVVAVGQVRADPALWVQF